MGVNLFARVLVVLLAASSHAAMAAPYSVHWLAWVAYLPMFAAIREDTPRANRWLAFLYGTISTAVIFRWLAATIPLYSNIPYVLSVAILLLFSTVFGTPWLLFWPLVHPLRRRLGVWWVAVLPAWWVVVEWISMRVLLFPYNQGMSQHAFLPLFQVAAWTGMYGLTWLVLFANAVWAEAVYRRRERIPAPVLLSLAPVALVSVLVILGVQRFASVEDELRSSPTLRIAMLQDDITMSERIRTGGRKAFDGWLKRTDLVPSGEADLIVWPEGASPYDLNKGKAASMIAERAVEKRAAVIVGGGTARNVEDERTGKPLLREFNTVFAFDDQGQIVGTYDKLVPLAFGEYFPGARWWPWLADQIEGIGDFQAGTEATVLEVASVRVATPICYEVILAHVCRRFESPDLLVNVTNDGWFGPTEASYLHGMLAEARAVELGIPLFRSAYTGTSMVVEPHGVVHSQTDVFTEVVQITTVRMGRFDTLYARLGDWFVGVCCLACLAAAAAIAAARASAPGLLMRRFNHLMGSATHPGADVEL